MSLCKDFDSYFVIPIPSVLPFTSRRAGHMDLWDEVYFETKVGPVRQPFSSGRRFWPGFFPCQA